MQKITFAEFKNNTQKPIKQAKESDHNYNITRPILQKQEICRKTKQFLQKQIIMQKNNTMQVQPPVEKVQKNNTMQKNNIMQKNNTMQEK